jgi:hypothetical protein
MESANRTGPDYYRTAPVRGVNAFGPGDQWNRGWR